MISLKYVATDQNPPAALRRWFTKSKSGAGGGNGVTVYVTQPRDRRAGARTGRLLLAVDALAALVTFLRLYR